jgi:hypothetical protein
MVRNGGWEKMMAKLDKDGVEVGNGVEGDKVRKGIDG